MPTERIAMRRVREMMRLSRDAGLATREVARRTGVAPSALREMFQRFERSGLTWPLPLDLADTDLEARLYGEAGTKQGHRRRAEPDWAALNRELKKKHVTLQIPGTSTSRPSRRVIAAAASATSTAVGGAPPGHHAPDPPGRRQAVHRPRRRQGPVIVDPRTGLTGRQDEVLQ